MSPNTMTRCSCRHLSVRRPNRLLAFRLFSVLPVLLAVIMALAWPVTSGAGEGEAAPAPTDEALTEALGQPYYSGGILPTPREVAYRDASVPLLDGPAGYRLNDLAVEYYGQGRELVLRLLEWKMAPYREQFPDAAWKAPEDRAPVPIVLALAADPNAKHLIQRFGLEDRVSQLRPQGYVLEVRPEGIIGAAFDRAGLINAAASLVHLMHVKDGRLVVREASILDWPTFNIRYVSEYHVPGPEFLDFLALYKINGFACAFPVMRWTGLHPNHIKYMKAVGEYRKENGQPHVQLISRIGGQDGLHFDAGDDAHIDTLIDTLTQAMKLTGADHVILAHDDVKLEKISLSMPKEKERFDSLPEAHGYVIDRVLAAMRQVEPDSRLSFCTAFYQGFKHKKWREESSFREPGLKYLADTRQWNKDAWLVWTGPLTESIRMTREDIDAYQDIVGRDRPLFYWDNTWHFRQPLRSFFASYPDGFVNHCAGRQVLLFINATRPIGRYFIATATDYYWNPEDFDNQRSWKHAAIQFMGKQALPAVTAFYELRGDSYMYYFSRGVDLARFREVVEEIDAASLDRGLVTACWGVYNSVCDQRKKPEMKKEVE